jgi:arylsulfatase A-like enzyme
MGIGHPIMKSKSPNFLFLFPDQHRRDWTSFNPDLPLRTPNLEKLAARGTRFTNAFTPSPVCSPARACLATGREYARCGVRHNGDNTPLTLPTYYRHLRDAGYQVSGTGKFDLHKPDRNWGLDGKNLLWEYGFTGGIDNEGKGDALTAYFENGNTPHGPYMQFLQDRGLLEAHLAMYEPHLGTNAWLNFPAVTTLPDEAYCDNWVAENAMQCLRDFSHEAPWHLVVNFVGPHGPFDITRSMRSRWEQVELPEPVNSEDPDKAAVLERRQNYAAMIENIDHHVGRLIDLVAERGELENTIIVYSSDHGEMLGDHNRWGKAVWFTAASGIPLVIAGPGVRSGVCTEAMVSLHDLAATFLDFAGAAPLPESDALSLKNLLSGNTDHHRDHLISALQKWQMVFDGRYKAVFHQDQDPMLFDTAEDPNELQNIAKHNPHLVMGLRARLHACRGEMA